MSLSIEHSVLRCLLVEPSLLGSCKLQSKDFTTETHRRVFSAICDLDLSSKPIDVITVAERIEQIHGYVDMKFMGDLLEAVGAPSCYESYQESILKSSRARQAREIAEKLIVDIDHKLDRDYVSEAIRDLMALDDSEKKYQYTIKEALSNALEHVQAALDAEGMVGIPTGIKRIDEATGGFQDTDLNVIAARPAMGKTALALNMALNTGAKVGFISAEQGNVQAALRMIAIQGSIDSQQLRTANLDETGFAMVSGAVQALQDREIFINDKPRISITDLVRQARDWKHNNGIQILFVDYLQKIQGSNTAFQRTEQVTEVTQSLKALARELNIPVVALAQVRRIDERTDKRPKLGDMADASEIEKEADVIMTLYRDEVYDEDSRDKGIAEIDVVKNRHGQTGVVRCAFKGRYFQFKDFQPVKEISNYRS